MYNKGDGFMYISRTPLILNKSVPFTPFTHCPLYSLMWITLLSERHYRRNKNEDTNYRGIF